MQSTRNLTKGSHLPVSLMLAVLMLFSTACQKEKRPARIMSETELTGFLVEVYLAEAKLGQIRVDRDSALRLFTPYETGLMAKRRIDSVVLKETYRYYLNHPAEFEKIYETIMDTLSLREQRAQASMRAAGTGPANAAKPEKRKSKKADSKKQPSTPVKSAVKATLPNKEK